MYSMKREPGALAKAIARYETRGRKGSGLAGAS
jgi:hypothetical protein